MPEYLSQSYIAAAGFIDEQVVQLQVIKLAHGQWFSVVTPVSSTTKTGRHDIAEILLKVVLNTINQIIKSNQVSNCLRYIMARTSYNLL